MSQGIYAWVKVERGAACLLCCGEGAIFFKDEEGIFMTSVDKLYGNMKNSGYAFIRNIK